MIIPDIVKRDFEEWYADKYFSKWQTKYLITIPEFLNNLPFEMQVGVFISYCDSKDIYIGRLNPEKDTFWLFTENKKYFDEEEWNYLDINNLTQISALNKAFKLIEDDTKRKS